MSMPAARVLWLCAKVLAILPSCVKCPLHSDAMFKMRVGVLLFSGSSLFIFILNKWVSIFLCHCLTQAGISSFVFTVDKLLCLTTGHPSVVISLSSQTH